MSQKVYNLSIDFSSVFDYFRYMKIERINENQIKCTLSRSDLASRQIRMSELTYGTEKTRGLFQDMMEQASNEVGFEARDLPLMIEAIPVSMDCIVLMITKVEDPEEMDTGFSSFTHLNDEGLEEDAPALPEQPEMERLFSFASLDTVIDFAHRMNGIYNGVNSLYKDKGGNRYYLLLSMSSHDIREFGMVCNSALEYGNKELMSFARDAYLEEHFDIIIRDNALQHLAEI